MDKLKSWPFALLTLTLVSIIIIEYLGLFNGINAYVYAHTPLINSSWVNIITQSASFGAFVLYILLFLIWDFKKERKLSLETLNFTLSIFLGMLLVGVLKASTDIPRPNEAPLHLTFFQALLNADYFAFPSGHTTRASILAYFLGGRYPKYRIALWGYALLIALSRLLLRVHWFSDVLFALFLGIWVSIIVESTAKLWLLVYNSLIEKLKLEVFRVE
ncbi:phosphatase PAP2 family protein [Thermococcus stetteri]|uniref:phosphatase PAP2 family protein n=1 Tax=Thermococcus stetteri TaxID=49900 RepID=UPI001AE60BA3|nr:phosphatase PAP2 family protein [Thermococcus stetteri]MBP1913011.1 undecaprenyl-diphosphatase [Thermococcus stetteri]